MSIFIEAPADEPLEQNPTTTRQSCGNANENTAEELVKTIWEKPIEKTDYDATNVEQIDSWEMAEGGSDFTVSNKDETTGCPSYARYGFYEFPIGFIKYHRALLCGRGPKRSIQFCEKVYVETGDDDLKKKFNIFMNQQVWGTDGGWDNWKTKASSCFGKQTDRTCMNAHKTLEEFLTKAKNYNASNYEKETMVSTMEDISTFNYVTQEIGVKTTKKLDKNTILGVYGAYDEKYCGRTKIISSFTTISDEKYNCEEKLYMFLEEHFLKNVKEKLEGIREYKESLEREVRTPLRISKPRISKTSTEFFFTRRTT